MTLRQSIFFRAGLAATLACLLAAAPLYAQSSAEPPTLIKHLRAELGAKDADRQTRALIDIISLANCQASCIVSLQSKTDRAIRIENETGAGNVFDLDVLTPDLLRVYRTGTYRNEAESGPKLLALSALINVGNQRALEQLVSEKETQTRRVQKATDRSLAAFYFAKYPELIERSTRNNHTFSLDDVQRAEVLRLKREKRAGGR